MADNPKGVCVIILQIMPVTINVSDRVEGKSRKLSGKKGVVTKTMHINSRSNGTLPLLNQ